MENRRVLIDTSVLIDFFRKKNKKKSLLYKIRKTHEIYASSVSEFEFLAGVKGDVVKSLKHFFNEINVIPFDSNAAAIASSIYKDLKARNLVIEFRDIFIAATAIAKDLPISTLNRNHFERIEELEILEI
ncbi:MAG: type II toxin-antitoxin system VapC family toxin [Candidatus Aminicenantes bacterium]